MTDRQIGQLIIQTGKWTDKQILRVDKLRFKVGKSRMLKTALKTRMYKKTAFDAFNPSLNPEAGNLEMCSDVR